MTSTFSKILTKLKKRHIIETLAAFIGGGWLLLEFVHWILVDHYHFPEKSIDITFITILGALLCTVIWRWFGGRERPGKLKPERFLVPLVALITLGLDMNLLFHLKEPGAEPPPASRWKNSVAVLPFVDMSPMKDQESFCDGITEDLINRLSNIKDLKVPARTSVFTFKGKTPEPREVGEKLKVQTMIEGSVQKAGNRLRITAQLINIADGYHLWSEKYDREPRDLFDIQDDISSAIANALRLELTSKERGDLTRRGTTNPVAFELYFKGKQFRYKERPRELLLAKACFEEAAQRDPNYAAAYAGLAENYMVLGLLSVLPRDEAADEARLATRRALKIAPDSSEAHVSSGVVKMVFDWDWKGAEREFKDAIALNPNNFDAHREYALLLVRNYRFDESEREFLRSIELDPLNGLPLRDLQSVYLGQGRADKAEEAKKRLAEIDPYWARWTTGFDLTVEEVEKDISERGRNIWSLIWLAAANYKLGITEEAAKIIKDVENLYEVGQGNVAYGLATYYCEMRQDRDRTLMWLERAVEGRAPALINVSRNPCFDFLLKETRFQEVLRRVGLK